MGRLFTLFTEKSLENAIAADADFEKAAFTAAVTGTTIAVVALFGRFQHSVSANRSSGDEGALLQHCHNSFNQRIGFICKNCIINSLRGV